MQRDDCINLKPPPRRHIKAVPDQRSQAGVLRDKRSVTRLVRLVLAAICVFAITCVNENHRFPLGDLWTLELPRAQGSFADSF